MCEPNGAASDIAVEDGITEEMDRILADPTPRQGVKTWEQIWKLLFPQDVSPLDSGECFIYAVHIHARS